MLGRVFTKLRNSRPFRRAIAHPGIRAANRRRIHNPNFRLFKAVRCGLLTRVDLSMFLNSRRSTRLFQVLLLCGAGAAAKH
jgi:hypothetical protein